MSGQTLSFAAGDTSETFTVGVNDDSRVEADETFTTSLSNVVDGGRGVTAGSGGTATIQNDDAAEFSISGVSQAEGAGDMTFTVTLSNPVDVAVSVDVSTADGTATTADGDYVAVSSQTLSFAAGDTSETFTVGVSDDSTVELDETFTTALSNVVDGGRGVTAGSDGTGTIENDDAAEFTIAAVGQAEAAGDMTFTVALSNPVDVAVSVDVSTADGTAATADGDYVAVSGQTVSFAAGDTSETFTVGVSDDSTVELDETFTTTLSGLVDGGRSVTAGSGGTGTIQNDDSAELTIAGVSQAEGAGDMTFTVTLSNPVDTAVSVDVSTADGTATTADNDYVAVSGQTVSFAAGDTSETFTVGVNDDSRVENDETFTTALSGLVDGGRGVSAGSGGTGTIENDDSATLRIEDVSQAEAGGDMTFTVTLSSPVGSTISVDVSTADGSATTADGDYVGVSGQTLSFAAGATSETFTVSVTDDSTVEVDETFTTVLSNLDDGGLNVALGTGGLGTIENDDSAELSIGAVSQAESAGAMTFTVALSNPVDTAISVDVSTADGTATTADGDYVGVSGQTLSFAAGSTSETFTVSVTDDSTVESDEVFATSLSNLVGDGRSVTVGSGGAGTIQNDDAAEFSIADVSQAEAAGDMTFTVTLSNPVDVATSVDVSTADGTATTADGDYVGVSGQTLSFAAGSTSETFTVGVNDDGTVEADEDFTADLGNLVDGDRAVSLGSGATGTIENDDAATLAIDDVSDDEGDSGTTAFTFTVSLSAPVDSAVEVDFATADGTATAGDDYTAAAGTITFAPGESSQTVTVDVTGDETVEPNEDFRVGLSNLDDGDRAVTVSDSQGDGLIVNDDGATLSIDDVSQAEGTETEGSSGLTAFTFTVTLSAPSSLAVTVDFATADGSAVAGDDYTAAAGTVTFAPGELTQTITVEVIADAVEEMPEETFVVELSNAAGGTVADGLGQATIVDDDDLGPPEVTVVDTVEGTGDGVLEECEEVRVTVNALRVTFDQAVRDPAGNDSPDDVTNPANYLLVAAGADNDLSTDACGPLAGDDVAVGVGAVSYDDATRTAELSVAGGFLLDSAYRLLVCDSILDPAGNPLGGGDFERGFRVERENLLRNGDLDCDVQDWVRVSSPPDEIVWDDVDVDSASISGSAEFANPGGGTEFSLGQCVDFEGAASFELEGAVRADLDPGAEVILGRSCEFFGQPLCAGDPISSALEFLPLVDTGGAWEDFGSELVTPIGMFSMVCSFEIRSPQSDSLRVWLDKLTLELLEAAIFTDGFESGDTSVWSQ